MPAQNPHPRTLILLHGFRGAPAGLSTIAEDLRAAGYEVHTPPVPPFAGAPALKAYTPDTYADYFAHLIQSQTLDRPLIIGHSMGSIVAAALADRYPRLIHPKLILLSPISTQPAPFFARLTTLPAYLPGRLTDFVTTTYLHLPASGANFHHILSLTHTCSHHCPPHRQDLIAAAKFSAQYAISDFRLKQDVLLIAGAHDRLIPRSETEALATQLRAKLRLLPRTGHLHNYEFPHLTAALIQSFIQS